MRSTRMMTWILLVLSLAFLCVPDFRWALELPFMDYRLSGIEDLDKLFEKVRGWQVPESKVRSLQTRAEKSNDAKALAYVALHLPTAAESFQTADKAVAIDPSVNWVGYFLVMKYMNAPGASAEVTRWLDRLEAAEPDNAFPYYLRATVIRSQNPRFPAAKYSKEGIDPSPFATQTAWLQAMSRAFAQPHYHPAPEDELFLLERSVLQREGWDTPMVLLADWLSYPSANLLYMRDYANYKVHYLAPQAEKARNHAEAMRQYRETAALGQRMLLESNRLLDQLIGIALNRIAGDPLAEALKKDGKNDEAAAVSATLEQEKAGVGMVRRLRYTGTTQLWDVILTHTLAWAVVFFGSVSLLLVLLVNLFARRAGEHPGPIFRFISVAENFMPIMFFASCVSLLVVYLPYGSNFRLYMSMPDPGPKMENMAESIDPFWESIALSDQEAGFLSTPIQSWLLCAAAGIVVVLLFSAWHKRRAKP